MRNYKLASFLGMAAWGVSALLFVGYVWSLIRFGVYARSNTVFFGVIGFFCFGLLCFGVRIYIKGSILLEIARSGRRATATILKSRMVSSEEVPVNKRLDQYDLHLLVVPDLHDEPAFTVHIRQLFDPTASGLLTPKQVVPARYAAESGLTLVTIKEAHTWLSSRSIPIVKDIRRPLANP